MDILLTNDDGIHAPGLRYIYHALKKAGHSVQVVAPLTEQSAVGHAITLSSPLRITEIKENGFEGIAVNSTPADCIKFALSVIYKDKLPDLVFSGINSGPNVGPDVMYSGTVAAATEASHNGCKAIALSFNSRRLIDLCEYADYAVELGARVKWEKIAPRTVLNVNFPNLPFARCKGLRICPQTSAVWRDHYEQRSDPEGRPYWWISGIIPQEDVAPDTDYALLSEGFITLTPLRFDFTNREALDVLKNLES